MNTNIKLGTISEYELVSLFGSDTVKKSYALLNKFKGHQKVDVLKKVSRYCSIKDLGNKRYKITNIYDNPLPSNYNKMTKSLYKYIVPLILNNLINGHDKNNSIEITVGKWAREINMINRNYDLVKYARENASSELQIQLDTINEFYDKADHMINWYITNALDYLKTAGLIIWREVNRVTVEESDGQAIIDHDGNVEVNINITTHQASKEEMEYYSQCIAIADKEANIESAGERYYSKKAVTFQNALKRELYKKKIKFIYNAYEAYYVHLDKCKSLLKSFGEYNTDKLIHNFNAEFSDMIIKNAGERFEKNAVKYLYSNKDDYKFTFGSLCDITINNETEYIGRRINKKKVDEDYNLQITHKRGHNKNEL